MRIFSDGEHSHSFQDMPIQQTNNCQDHMKLFHEMIGYKQKFARIPPTFEETSNRSHEARQNRSQQPNWTPGVPN